LTVLSKTADRYNLKSGSYSLTIYDGKGCTMVIDSFKIINGCPSQNDCSSLTVSTTVTNKTCTEGGKILLNIAGGTSPYTIDWLDLDLASNPQNRFGLDSGSYSVIVTDATGCKTQFNNILIKNSCPSIVNCTPPVIGDVAVVDATCNQSNGQITVSVLRPSNVTYRWSSNISTSSVARNVPAGIYKLKVMTAGDSACAVERDIIVKNQNGISIGQPNILAATCGASNGRVEFPGTGAAVIYTWNDGKTGSVRSDLARGTYLITVSDPTGAQCTQYLSVEVPANSTLMAGAIVNRRAVCGQANGQATIRVMGGSGSYTYSWGTSATKSDLKSGVTNVIVTDNQTGCQVNVVVTMTDEVTAFATVNVAQPMIYLSCAGENNASVVYNISYSSGFALPSRVVISDNLGRTAKNDSLSVGRYAIFVYDKNNCLAGLGNFEVREPQMLILNTSSASQTCSTKGSIALNVSGGSGVYTYKWADLTGSDQPKNRTDLAAGNYLVTVTDSRGCIRAAKITIANEAINCDSKCDLLVTPAASAKTCTEGGRIDLTILNGSNNYGFLWSDLGTVAPQPQNRTRLNAGIYSVTVIDSTTLCKVTLTNIIVENKAVNCPVIKCTFIARADVKNKTCTEGGNILVTPLTGAKPYTYDWLDLQGLENPQNRFNLIAGQYTVIITDSIGCRDTMVNIAIKDSCFSNCTPPVIANLSVNDATCFEKNGSATITMSGTTGFKYQWYPNVSTTNTATGLIAGIYTVRISRLEDTLCFIEKKIVVSNKNEGITLGAPTVKNATCGTSDGSITINGQTAWTYKWSDGASGRTRTNVAPNTYYVSVTDPSVNGCPVVQEVVVKMDGSLQVSAVVNKKPTCGASNGQVTVGATGGSGNYNYSWGSAVRSNLKAGTYTVTVYDTQTGCSGITIVSLTEDIAAVATINITTTRFVLNCRGDQTGRIDYTVNYAPGFAQPAVVKIFNEGGFEVENGKLKVGKYRISVIDGNGCVAGMASFEMTEPDIILAQANIKGANCTTLGTIGLNVTGGAGGFTYDWADIAGTSDSKDRTGLNAGVYSVTVKDMNGCTVTLKNVTVANLCQSIKPKRDTVYYTMIVGRIDSVCMMSDAALAGQTLNYTFCNGSSVLTSGLGSASISSEGCVLFKSSNTVGTDQICVKSCTSGGVCDTSILVLKILEDPSGCKTSYLGSTTLTVTRCDTTASACTNIPYSQLSNYTVTDNGVATQFSTTGCRQDTVFAYSYFTLTKFYPNGPWDLDSWNVNGQIFKGRIASLKTLVDSMNVWDRTGNWTLDEANKVIVGGGTQKVYGNMVWKRSGRTVATFQPNRQFRPVILSIKLAVGKHKIVFTDKVKGCKDSTNITVVCNADPLRVASYTIDTVIRVGQSNTVCLNNWAYASQSIIRNVCMSSFKGYTGYAVDDNNDCIRLTGITIGRDTLCLRRCYASGQCDTIRLVVSVLPALAVETGCTKLYTGLNYFNVPCGTKAKICTNLQGSDTLAFTITDNGVNYKNGYFACSADTTYSYSYFSLVLNSPTGPWKLDSWIINGSTFSGTIPSVKALVDSMNRWDIGGNWILETSSYTIKGGKSGNNYGNMTWSKNNSRIGSFGPNRQFIIRQVGMYLDAGRHQIVFKNIAKNCSDTANILVECRLLRTRPSMTIKDTTIFVNETGKFCLPTNGLMASNTQITTVCNTKGYVNYVVDDNSDCLVLTGANVGKDTICLQRCDFDGECDTVKVAVTVLRRKSITSETVFHSTTVGKDSTYCVNTSELSGKKFTLKNVCDPNTTDNVSFIINSTCVTYFATRSGVDTACLVVSDELGNSDTTRLIVYVIQEREALPTPIAIRDRATTAKGTSVIIKPMDNDSLFGLPSNIIVLTQPTAGRLSFDPATNNVVYSPMAGSDCVNRDSFRYAVINRGGKDTAEVAVEVLCDEIVVFSGFSPNGDGTNDTFTILGLEKYPNNQLFVFSQRGNQVFTATNYKSDWNATQDGVSIPDGTYFWILDLGNGKKQSGYVQIHR
jgi:gliding motility-associated-like protein